MSHVNREMPDNTDLRIRFGNNYIDPRHFSGGRCPLPPPNPPATGGGIHLSAITLPAVDPKRRKMLTGNLTRTYSHECLLVAYSDKLWCPPGVVSGDRSSSQSRGHESLLCAVAVHMNVVNFVTPLRPDLTLI